LAIRLWLLRGLSGYRWLLLHLSGTWGVGVVIAAHGFAKALDGFTDIAAQALEALGAKQQKHDQQYDHQLPDSDATHFDHSCKVMKMKANAAARR